MYTPNCDVFWVGSYPLRDPDTASRRILKHSELLLHWPQLPKRSAKERFFEQTYASLATPSRDDFPRGYASGWSGMWRLLKAKKRKSGSHPYFKTQLAGPVTLFGKLQSKAAN